MTPERLASLPDWGFCPDAESHRFQPGMTTPPLVCGSVAVASGGRIAGQFCTADQWLDAVEAALADARYVIVNLNVAFDLRIAAVEVMRRRGRDLLPAIFQAYVDGRVFDPGIAEALDAVAGGHLRCSRRAPHGRLRDPVTNEEAGYRLSVVCDEVLGIRDAKEHDRFRQSYALLEGLDPALWPPDATQYPVDDTVNGMRCALVQAGHLPGANQHAWVPDVAGGDTCAACGHRWLAGDLAGPDGWCPAPRPRRNLHDLARQCYADWCLQLGAGWGFRTDGGAIEVLERCAARGRDRGRPKFQALGLLREDGTGAKSSLMRAVALAYGCHGACGECADGRIYKTGTKGQRLSASTACKLCCGTGLVLSTAPVPMTEPTPTNPHGSVQTGRDVLIDSGDEDLVAFAEYHEDDKIPGYCTDLREGVAHPWTQRPNTVLETGRVSYSGKVMLMPRKVSDHLTEALRQEATA